MEGWRSRCISAEEAAKLVGPGDHVFVGSACATPRTLISALEKPSSAPSGVRLIHFLTDGSVPVLGTQPFTSFQRRTFFVGTDMLEITPDKLEYIPIALGDVPSQIASGRIRIDVAVVQVSPPDDQGKCSLGVSVDISPAAIAAARLLIAEINPHMPRTEGHPGVSLDIFDACVAVDDPVIEYRHPEVGAASEQIARYVARLVRDGAALQVGLGRVPNEMLRYLGERRSLRVHSDVITDAVMELDAQGALDRSYPVVTSWAMGTKALYDALDQNPRYRLEPIDQICQEDRLRDIEGFVSVTQAFSIDLTGQVCAEWFEGRLYGGLSTQPTFHRAATTSPGGRAIVALTSISPSGESNIKLALGAGEAVAIPRAEVRWVVTEFGTAYLYGRSLRQRAISLIEIAHPDHRESLLHAAISSGLLREGQKLKSRTAYPIEDESTEALREGRTIRLRPTRTTDAPLLQDLFHRLRPKDVRTRFFRNLNSLRLDMAEHLCSVGYEDEMAFVAVVGDQEDEQIVGASCYYVDAATQYADVAYMVDPSWQGKGLGQALQLKTTAYAVKKGIRGFTADVLTENAPMLKVLAKGPYEMTKRIDSGAYEVRMTFV